VDRGLDADQRAADDGALQRPLRLLVSARRRRAQLRARLPAPDAGGRAGDAGDPGGRAAGAPGADRGSREDARDAGPGLPGGVRERAPLGDRRPAHRPTAPDRSDVALPGVHGRAGRVRAGGVPRRTLPAGHPRHQPLPDERALSRPAAVALPGAHARQQRHAPLRRHRGRARAARRPGRPGDAAARGLGAASAAAGRDRGAPGLHARAAAALARPRLAGGRAAARRGRGRTRGDAVGGVRLVRLELAADAGRRTLRAGAVRRARPGAAHHRAAARATPTPCSIDATWRCPADG
jgi:hypothetical protein